MYSFCIVSNIRSTFRRNTQNRTYSLSLTKLIRKIIFEEKGISFSCLIEANDFIDHIQFYRTIFLLLHTKSFERHSLLLSFARGNDCCDLSPRSFSFSFLQKFTQCLSLLRNNGTPFLVVTDIFLFLSNNIVIN